MFIITNLLHSSIMQFLLSVCIMVISSISTSIAMVPKSQHTMVGEVKTLYQNTIDAQPTPSALSLQLMCSSSQCQLCLGTCDQCRQCKGCLMFCRGKTGGFCSRCSFCAGGTEHCRRRCRQEQNSRDSSSNGTFRGFCSRCSFCAGGTE